MNLLRYKPIIFGGSTYMRRWTIEIRWFTVRVHHILRSDSDRALHDHPWSFLSIILAGGYYEHRPLSACVDGQRRRMPRAWGTEKRWHGPGSIRFRRATDLHRLELPAPCWTLVLSGPKHRIWGFQTPDGWIPWNRWVEYRKGVSYGTSAHPEGA